MPDITGHMRILKVVQSYFPFQERGGPVFKVRALATGLAKRGHQVTVLTADLGFGKGNGFHVEAERGRWGWTVRSDGVEAIYLSTIGQYRAVTLNPGVFAFCRGSICYYDVVHFYGLYDLLGPAASRFCRRQSVPYVIEPMGMYPPIVRSLRLKRMYLDFLGDRFIRGGRYLVATSEQEKCGLIDGGIDAARVDVRRNGIELPSREGEPGKFRGERGISSDAKVILFLGRLVSKKSPDMLLQAFANWRADSGRGQDAVLVLAGPEEGDGYLAKLRSMVDRLGIQEQVLFAGPLYDDAKWSAYRDADVCVLPSQNENFGNTAGEAAACGTPVIVTDRCGIAPFVGAAGEVIPHDLTALENALGRMLREPMLRENRRAGCRAFVENLSWEGPLDQTEEMYRRCSGQ
jgi:glycosyltransferase involved in cell wall biosynthesis